MPALEGERAVFGPGAQDQIVSFVEALARVGRVDAEREILAADAAHKTGNDAPARHHIEHRHFFGDAQRVVA
jgi:hypothetical protein